MFDTISPNEIDTTNIPRTAPQYQDIERLLKRLFDNSLTVFVGDIELNEDEKIANFFLGIFPKINDPNDLALELSTFFEDLQVHAKAKGNKQIIDFCNFFADNSDQLAEDLLQAKVIISKKVRDAVKDSSQDREFEEDEIEDAFEEAGEMSPVQRIKMVGERFAQRLGMFRAAGRLNGED